MYNEFDVLTLWDSTHNQFLPETTEEQAAREGSHWKEVLQWMEEV